MRYRLSWGVVTAVGGVFSAGGSGTRQKYIVFTQGTKHCSRKNAAQGGAPAIRQQSKYFPHELTAGEIAQHHHCRHAEPVQKRGRHGAQPHPGFHAQHGNSAAENYVASKRPNVRNLSHQSFKTTTRKDQGEKTEIHVSQRCF